MTSGLRAVRLLAASEHPTVVRLRDRVGRARDRLDHPQLRDARRLLAAADHASLDVLFLGESVLNFVGPEDADRRRLPTMVADGLGPAGDLLAVHGGGYHAELLATYLELLEQRGHRPKAVIVALWVRGRFAPWMAHPVFGHLDAMARLQAIDPGVAAWRVRGSLRRPPYDSTVFHAVRHATMAGDLTVGDYARPLKAGDLVGAERLRLLYAYHHGAALDAAALTAVTRLGAVLARMGCAVVAYQTPICVETGVRALGPELAALVTANFAAIDAAFQRGVDTPVLQTGTAFGVLEFIDPDDGSEHLNSVGRQRLADLLVAATQTASREGSGE